MGRSVQPGFQEALPLSDGCSLPLIAPWAFELFYSAFLLSALPSPDPGSIIQFRMSLSVGFLFLHGMSLWSDLEPLIGNLGESLVLPHKIGINLVAAVHQFCHLD